MKYLEENKGSSKKQKGNLHQRGKGSGNQRKMGLITTQLLNVHNNGSSDIPSQTNNDSRGGSKISIYTDNYEQNNRTIDQLEEHKMIGSGNTAILTDTKINLFSTQTLPAQVQMSNKHASSKKPASATAATQSQQRVTSRPTRSNKQGVNHSAGAKIKHKASSSVPTSRRDQDSLMNSVNSNANRMT